MQDGDICYTKFHKVLQERENFRKLKANIRNQAKAKVRVPVPFKARNPSTVQHVIL